MTKIIEKKQMRFSKGKSFSKNEIELFAIELLEKQGFKYTNALNIALKKENING